VLIQRGAPDRMRGRAVAVLMSSTYATLAVAMAAAGPLTNVLGARVMWALAGCVYLGAALVALALSRVLRTQDLEEQQAPDSGRMREPVEVAAKS
jgi:predicted MFS family arabinose efflux permease